MEISETKNCCISFSIILPWTKVILIVYKTIIVRDSQGISIAGISIENFYFGRSNVYITVSIAFLLIIIRVIESQIAFH